jgi:pilus assembly protein CpaF
MAMMSDIDMPLTAMRIQIASGVNIIVQVSRLQDGSRKMTHITEVLGFDIAAGAYITEDIYRREYEGVSAKGEVVSHFEPTGYIPRCLEQLIEHGCDLPKVVYQAAERRKANAK